jgi:hypothetical protein
MKHLAFIVICLIASVAAAEPNALTDNDWPSANPSGPPSIKTFEKYSGKDLIAFLVDTSGTAEWHENKFTACAQFMWLTRDAKEGQEFRARLAASIFKKLDTAENPHDIASLAGFLGHLHARDQIIALLSKLKCLDCCYGPALIHALAECGNMDDAPLLIACFDKETESSGGMSHVALVQLTKFNPLPDAHWPYDRAQAKALWTQWLRERKADSR